MGQRKLYQFVHVKAQIDHVPYVGGSSSKISGLFFYERNQGQLVHKAARN